MSKTGSHWPSTSRWDFHIVCETKNPRDKCLSPTWSIQVGYLESWFPESLWNSLAHFGQWWGWWQWPGKGKVGCMALQTPNLRNSSPSMALTGDIVRATQWEWKTGFNIDMGEVVGTQEASELGREASDDQVKQRSWMIYTQKQQQRLNKQWISLLHKEKKPCTLSVLCYLREKMCY